MKTSIDEGLFIDENTLMVIKYLREVQAEAIEKELPEGPVIPGPPSEPIIHTVLDEIFKNKLAITLIPIYKSYYSVEFFFGSRGRSP